MLSMFTEKHRNCEKWNSSKFQKFTATKIYSCALKLVAFCGCILFPIVHKRVLDIIVLNFIFLCSI